ncbi:helix-turn-helix domain-containing protein [Paenibacillus sp. GCM10027626]|uniref:helix-turn-helix domain-containing protein n=1 Tax=Paenibacillus sp. GCM10027626 TaxID=3273411 RepID=UPI003631977B
MEKNTLLTTGDRIRYFRKLKGLTQEQLAEIVGTNFSYIGKIERGQHDVRLQTLEKLAQALDVPLSSFFMDSAINDELVQNDLLVEAVVILMKQTETDQKKAVDILNVLFRT